MGMFDQMKDAMKMAQSPEAQQAMQQAQQTPVGDQMGARNAFETQAHEFNRILTVGTPAQALIKGHTDTGENLMGNPVWDFDLEVTPEGGEPYAVKHREIVSSMAVNSYGDGTTMACKIDPEDPQKIAFGEKPFM
jgi:hypothetical protein